MCFENPEKELNFCHHLAQPTYEPSGERPCRCFCGYTLCDDGFTCNPLEAGMADDEDCVDIRSTPQLAKVDRSRRSLGCDYDNNEFDLGGNCYHLSSAKRDYNQARNNCNLRGGQLAQVNDRKTWWFLLENGKINNYIPQYNTGVIDYGRESIWVSESSSAENAVVHQVDNYIKCGASESNTGVLINKVQDKAFVPPQWDTELKTAEHYYACEFKIGSRTEFIGENDVLMSSNESNEYEYGSAEPTVETYDASMRSDYDYTDYENDAGEESVN